MNYSIPSMNAPLTPITRSRKGVSAYPFCWCMARQVLVVVLGALLFAGGIYAGHFATIAWPGTWAVKEDHLDAVVLDKLKSELHLTPEQTARITPVIAAACTNLQQASEERRAERLAVMDEISTTIAPQLSPDQQKKLNALDLEMQNRVPVKRGMRIVALF